MLQAFRDQHVQRDRAAYESYLREPLGEAEKAPFVVDVWLKEEELTTGQPLTVALPTGATTLLELDESLDSGAVYPLYSTTGEELPFLARVCVFNRSPFLVRS